MVGWYWQFPMRLQAHQVRPFLRIEQYCGVDRKQLVTLKVITSPTNINQCTFHLGMWNNQD